MGIIDCSILDSLLVTTNRVKMEKPVINLDLLEPEAIQQLHGNLAQQIDGMQQARYNMTKIAELVLATDSNLKIC